MARMLAMAKPVWPDRMRSDEVRKFRAATVSARLGG
jgi:hypothetical protein